MNELIGILIIAGNGLAWLAAARYLYRRWRNGGIAPLEGKPEFVVILVMLTAIMWPAVFMAMTVVAAQPPTANELEEQAEAPIKALKQRELELSIVERELSIVERELGLATINMNSAANGNTVKTVEEYWQKRDSIGNKSYRREWKDPLNGVKWHD